MPFFISPLVRWPVTVILLALLGTSVLCIKNILTKTWQLEKQGIDRYLQSPNCSTGDPSKVDYSLPPCVNVTWQVTAKPQSSTVDHYRYRDYPTIHRRLTLDDGRGRTQTVGDIYPDMWNSIKVGDQVSVKLWQNRVHEVTANGYSSSILDDREWDRASSSLWRWLIVVGACFCGLGLMWGHRRWGASRWIFRS